MPSVQDLHGHQERNEGLSKAGRYHQNIEAINRQASGIRGRRVQVHIHQADAGAA